VIDRLEIEQLAPRGDGRAVDGPEVEHGAAFEIRDSDAGSPPQPTIPADLATCEDCLAEIGDRRQRRFGYPFTNCTNCGPRWSIIEGLPYDRPLTTMRGFALCEACRAEYEDPTDRRFHAQPVACPKCGPGLQLLRPAGWSGASASSTGDGSAGAGENGRMAGVGIEGQSKRDATSSPAPLPQAGEGSEADAAPFSHVGEGRLQAAGDDVPGSGDAEALCDAAAAVEAGQILALKGLGGFQLIVDATSAEAVERLRMRKRRPDKPLAVMVRNVDEARRYCLVSPEEARELSSPQAPILLLRRKDISNVVDKSPELARRDASAGADSGNAPVTDLASPPAPVPQAGEERGVERPIADQVAPRNPYLGVMLPYTPLHHLLLQRLARPIVCTSGNLSEEPMATTTAEAIERLGSIADVILTHNRPIARAVDDSVGRVTAAGLQILRRARGYAPRPITLPQGGPAAAATDRSPTDRDLDGESKRPTILAVGGHLKNVVGLGLGDRAVLSSHVGDLDTVSSVEAFRGAIDDLLGFFDVAPELIACDLHPDYASTRRAEQLAAGLEIPLVRVQHHHAHVAAVAAEHALQGPVLGFSWDGTGYGPDGTVWGGEALVCEGASMRRIAHWRTFPLPGGDRAAREPRRSALGLLFELFHPDELPPLVASLVGAWFKPAERDALWQILSRSVRAPRTSSMGRLFDAVAAIVGLPPMISFEGQAAMQLEFAADPEHDEAYPVRLGDGDPIVIDWEPAVRAMLDDLTAGLDRSTMAARFHNMLAEAAVQVARRARSEQIALTGGCFQNALLEDRLRRRLEAEGQKVYTAQQVPPGDGGVALGQLAVAAAEWNASR
jgi:hydrogenase maturation protein HypF